MRGSDSITNVSSLQGRIFLLKVSKTRLGDIPGLVCTSVRHIGYKYRPAAKSIKCPDTSKGKITEKQPSSVKRRITASNKSSNVRAPVCRAAFRWLSEQ